MKVISAVTLAPTYTVTTSESDYDDWSSGYYWRGQRVHDPVSAGGDGHDYRMRWWYYNSTSRPSVDRYPWEDLGAAGGETSTYDTNVETSNFTPWVTGALPSGFECYSAFSLRDYLLVHKDGLTAGENTLDPSVAINSNQIDDDGDAISEYWYDIGPVNFMRMFDGQSDRQTEGTSTIETTARGEGECDAITFAGMDNVKSIAVAVTAGEILDNPSFTSSSISAWIANSPYAATSHITGAMRIVVSSSTWVGAWTQLSGLTIGATYTVSMVVTTGAESARLSVHGGIAYGPLLATSGEVSGTDQAVSVTFTATTTNATMAIQCSAPGTFDVKSVSAKHYNVGTINLSESDLEYSFDGAPAGAFKRIYRFDHSTVSWPQYDITLTAPNTNEKLYCGLVSAGKELKVGTTEANIEVTNLDFSANERDETYGTIRKFLPRGSATRFRATIWIDQSDADYLAHQINALRGQPLIWDFNNESGPCGGTITDYTDRIIAHGFLESWYTTVAPKNSMEVMVMNFEGMVT